MEGLEEGETGFSYACHVPPHSSTLSHSSSPLPLLPAPSSLYSELFKMLSAHPFMSAVVMSLCYERSVSAHHGPAANMSASLLSFPLIMAGGSRAIDRDKVYDQIHVVRCVFAYI